MTITTTTTNATALPEGVRWAMPVEELEAENAAQEASLKSKYEAEANAACEAGPEACKALLSDVGYALEFHLEPGLVRRVREMAHAPVTVFSDAPEYKLLVERFGCHAVTWSEDDLSGCTIEGEVVAEARRFLQSKAVKLARKRAVKHARRKAAAEARREKAREEAVVLEEAKAAVAAAVESDETSTAWTGGDDSTSAASVEGCTTAAPVSVSVSGFSSASLSEAVSLSAAVSPLASGESTGSAVAEEGALEAEGALKAEGGVVAWGRGAMVAAAGEAVGVVEEASFQVLFTHVTTGATHTVEGLTASMPVALLQRLIAEKSRSAVPGLVLEGRQLDASWTVGACGVSAGCTVHASGWLRGGGDGISRTPMEAQRCLLNAIGGPYLEGWPEEMRISFFGAHQYSYEERLYCGKFLYGNLRDVDPGWRPVLRTRRGC